VLIGLSYVFNLSFSTTLTEAMLSGLPLKIRHSIQPSS
jgi:hypothetical protein